MSDAKRLRIAVAGGSIAGLCAGIALGGIGADVQVFERHPGPMETRGAGIVVQGDLVNLLRQHNAPPLPMTACRVRRYLQPDGGAGQVEPMPQQFTSWEAIYKTLRATFPAERYHMGSPVLDFAQTDHGITADVEGHGSIAGDILICADGANSESRRRLIPACEPHYAGYIAWRGTLDEADAPSHLVELLDQAFTFSEARSGGHMLAYLIPGENADPSPGKRRLNWVWYVHAGDNDLDRLLVDSSGHRHHASLPQGLAPPEAVRELCAQARREVHPRLAELIAATPDPFIQTIIDIAPSQTLFGRVMLLGDAAFVVRPHTAAAAAKAAHEAMVLAGALRRARQNVDGGLRSAESLQLELGRGLSRYGIALGKRWHQNVASGTVGC